jgi:N-acetylmuramoyl-L-alanine amidase
MAIKDLPKYKDIRGSIRRKGRYSIVGTAVKDTHVIHHSMTAQHLSGSTPAGFANTHIDSNGWPGIAYAFVIGPDGTIYQCDDLDRRTYHAGDTNTRSIGTCLIGDFRKEGAAEEPTAEQKESLYLLNKELYKVLPNMERTIGHQECPGYAWKNCPGDTWNYKAVIAERPFKIAKEESWMAEKFEVSNKTLQNSVVTVLARFEQKDPALSKEWRDKFAKGELTNGDAIGILYHGVFNGWITGIQK